MQKNPEHKAQREAAVFPCLGYQSQEIPDPASAESSKHLGDASALALFKASNWLRSSCWADSFIIDGHLLKQNKSTHSCFLSNTLFHLKILAAK